MDTPDGEPPVVRFDLARGAVSLESDGPHVVLDVESFLALTGGTGAEALGERVGRTWVDRINRQLAAHETDLAELGAPAVIDHLGRAFAVAGMGSLSLERWGKALVFVLRSEALDHRSDGWCLGLLRGALGRILNEPVAAAVLARDEETLKMVIGKPATMDEVKRALEHQPPLEVLQALSRGRGDGA